MKGAKTVVLIFGITLFISTLLNWFRSGLEVKVADIAGIDFSLGKITLGLGALSIYYSLTAQGKPDQIYNIWLAIISFLVGAFFYSWMQDLMPIIASPNNMGYLIPEIWVYVSMFSCFGLAIGYLKKARKSEERDGI